MRTTPQEITDFCSSDEIENITNIEHLTAILSRILKRLDALETPPKKR